jgi:hypothetical protein
MTLDVVVATRLWQLFQIGLVHGDEEKSINCVEIIREERLELPLQIDMLLTTYLQNGDKSILWEVALVAVEGFYDDAAQRTRLVALLMANCKIDIQRAFKLLSFDGINTDDLDSAIRRVVDVVWLLKQDLEHGFMDPSRDNLLAEALLAVAAKEVTPGESTKSSAE